MGLIGGGPDAIEGLRIGAKARADGRGDRGLARRMSGIKPGLKYAAQLRTRAANGKVAYSERRRGPGPRRRLRAALGRAGAGGMRHPRVPAAGGRENGVAAMAPVYSLGPVE